MANREVIFDENGCAREFECLKDAFASLSSAYETLVTLRSEHALSWGGDSAQTFDRKIADFSVRFSVLEEKWQEAVARYEHSLDCVRRLNAIRFR